MTMFAHARYGELNHSNNPTFVTSSLTAVTGNAGRYKYTEEPRTIKNVVYSKFWFSIMTKVKLIPEFINLEY